MSAHAWGTAFFVLIALGVAVAIWRIVADARRAPPQLIAHPSDPPESPRYEWIMIVALIVATALGAIYAL